MSRPDARSPLEIIETRRSDYLDEVPDPDPDWPPDVRIVYRECRERLFEMGLEAQEVVADCGIGSHDIYSRFRYFTAHGIKEFLIHHRLQLAKRLLRNEPLSVTQVAFAIGYSSLSGFCKTFKRRVGNTPVAFREDKK